jgi:hypothetical protein
MRATDGISASAATHTAAGPVEAIHGARLEPREALARVAPPRGLISPASSSRSRRERVPMRLSVGLYCARRLAKRGGLSAP